MHRHRQVPWRPLAAALALAALPALAAAADPQWDRDAARHLLARACFTADPDAAARLAGMPLEKAVKGLLDGAEGAPLPGRPEWVRDQWVNYRRRWSDMSREEYLIFLRRDSIRNDAQLNELRAWWLQEMITTDAPLREAMTLFWHGHFTSATGSVFGFTQAFYQQNDLFRRRGLGNFRQLLGDVTLDPAMMAYLNLEASDKSHPNENYARELLELFTLGVGNYTERDILEIARVLSGWTLDAPKGTVVVDRPTDPDRLQFPSITRDGLAPTFHPERHDGGPATVFGRTGRFTIDDVLDMIVRHPACGQHLAGRLIAHFGAADPDGSLRRRMAQAFADSGHEIRPMLEVLFTAPEFYAPESRGNRIKSPVRLLVGACRDLKLGGRATPALAQLTVAMGQELFNPPTVKGWPSGEAWVSASTLALRYRLGEALLDGREPGPVEPLGRLRLTPLSRDPKQAEATVARLLQIDAERQEMRSGDGIAVTFDPGRLAPPGLAADPAALVDRLLGRLLVTPPRAVTRAALAEAAGQVPEADRVKLVAQLILAAPEYQLD